MGLAVVLSKNRRRIPWRLVAVGFSLQVAFALLVLRTTFGRSVFQWLGVGVQRLLGFSAEGARFVFGNLVDSAVPVVAVGSPSEGGRFIANTGALIAFNVLPSIVFFSSLSAVLQHVGVLPWLIRQLARGLRRGMGVSAPESLVAAANVFVGQTEAPLLVRPHLAHMTPSGLHAVMTTGFATVAGGVLAAYVGLLRDIFPEIAGHLLAASVMSAPAALVMAKIMVPEVEPAAGQAEASEAKEEERAENLLDAATRGASSGLALALNVGAMLIVFVALVALANFGVGAVGAALGAPGVTLQSLLGLLLAPLAFTLGVPWHEAREVGALLGTKTILNEFVAYVDLARALEEKRIVSEESRVVAAYALCGFSNLGSVGIQIAGLGLLAPSRRRDLSRLAIRALCAASLACFQTAAIAALLS